jgi:hypothetical protein
MDLFGDNSDDSSKLNSKLNSKYFSVAPAVDVEDIRPAGRGDIPGCFFDCLLREPS